MKRTIGFAIGVVALSALAAPEWPAPTAETKPWTINWWPASAVDEKGLAAQMDALAEAGFGGMRVIPIYEVKGYETNGVEMLTDEWYRRYRLGYDLAKAHGLEVDLSMGAGWCFGGKWIPKRLGVHALVGITNGQPVVEFKRIGVKRTSKADWGWMINPFSMEAMELHLRQFERFGKDGIPCPRAFCHDSFEYFFASWSDDMRTVPDTPGKLPLYRRELSDREVAVFSRWADWCRQRGIRTCNQAHGSPGDLLSLYALADIPETEMFGDAPNEYVSKFASSAAHLKGTQTVGAETFTWLDEHFRETPEKMKHAFDLLVLSGVNQVYLEGMCYSAVEAEWPGWLFYAASQVNPRNPLWNHLKAFWTYVERNQNLSQTSVDDADLLVYHPFENWWRKPMDGKSLSYAQQMTVHDTSWLTTYPLLRHLAFHGIAFDYVSEGTLHFLEERAHHYKAILIPPEHDISPAAEEKIAELARKQGLRILRPASLRDRLCAEELKAIDAAGVRREPFCGPGRDGRYVRFRRGKDTLYFVLNPSGKPIKGPFRLSVPVKEAWILDAMDGSVKPLEVAADGAVVCDIPSDAARWIWTSPDGKAEAKGGARTNSAAHPLTFVIRPSSWTLTPVTGGPEPLPAPRTMTKLSSWSTRADGTDEPFCGTMRYETEFDLEGQVKGEAGQGNVLLDLGEVKWTARVMLNGCELATLVAPPYAVRVPGGLLREKGNRLVVEVANLGRNRIRDLDRRGIEWRKFFIVDRGYKTFNLKDAPVEPSGLMGPVTLNLTGGTK